MTKKERLGYAVLAVFGITVAMWIPAGYTEGLGVLLAIIPLTIAVFYYGFSLTQNQQAQTDREQELLKRLEHMEQSLQSWRGSKINRISGDGQWIRFRLRKI